jgi:hypothetical protein
VSWPGSHGGEYDGQLSAGNMFGSGKMTFRDGSVYQGEWSDNMPHGRGRMAYSSTEHYEGEWERGLPHGEGTLDYGGGIVLTGKWVKGMCVMGELKMASGAVYSGEFGAQCVFHGIDMHPPSFLSHYSHTPFSDCSLLASNSCFKRFFNRSPLPNTRYLTHLPSRAAVPGLAGLGKIKFADGSSYSGNWAEGERHGAGEMTYADGSVYQGSWRAGARHGKGKVTYAGKRRVVVFCMWKDDDMGEKLTLAGEQWHSVDGWVAKAKKDGHGSQWALLDGEELEDGRAGLGGARGWRDHIVRWRKGATRR